MKKHRLSTSELILCAMFTALTAVGAAIRIPIPVVPFTLQFLFVLLAGYLLGPGLGAVSVSVYIGAGLIGLPVFAEGGGPGYLLKPSFGYLVGFAAAAYVTGRIAARSAVPSFRRLIAAGFAGLGIVYLFGMAYYYILCNYVINTPISFGPLFLYCFVLAVPGDVFLCIFGASLAKRLIPVMEKIIWKKEGELNVRNRQTD